MWFHKHLEYSLFVVLLSSIFPVSSWAYLLFQREKRFAELKDDFVTLGIESEALIFSKISTLKSFVIFTSHSLLTALLVLFGASILFLDSSQTEALTWLKNPTMVRGLRCGFLGAYIFSLQLIYRRYTTLDLQPTVYMNCTVTFIASFAFNFTAFAAIGTAIDADAKGLDLGIFSIVAFSLGYFPLLAIRWFNRIANSALGNKPKRDNSIPLSTIDGISQLHETRLRDEGIDNIQNLASVKLKQLLLKTRFNAQQVIEWVDQAILHIYVNPNAIDSFRRAGVRTISDLHAVWEPYFVEPSSANQGSRPAVPAINDGLKEARQKKALQLQTTPDYLDTIYTMTRFGPNIAYISDFWKNMKEQVHIRQEVATEEVIKEAKSGRREAQREIFKKIGNCDLHDNVRHSMGEVATKLIPDPGEFVSNYKASEEPPDILNGIAWWLWQLAEHNGNSLSADERDYFKMKAIEYYDKAADQDPDNPKIRYEIAETIAGYEEHHIKAKKYVEDAVELSKSRNDNDIMIHQLARLALKWIQVGNQDEGKEIIKLAKSTLEDFNDNGSQIRNLEDLRGISDEYKKLLAENNKLPEEFIEFSRKVDAIDAAVAAPKKSEAPQASGESFDTPIKK